MTTLNPHHDDDEIVVAPDIVELELAKMATTTAATATKTAKDIDPFLVTFDQPYDVENPLD